MLFILLSAAGISYFSSVSGAHPPPALPQSVALLIPFIHHTLGFYHWGRLFENVLSGCHQLTAVESTALGHTGHHQDYGWSWTNPTLSLLLHPTGGDCIILNSGQYTGWQPFLPENTSGIDLSLYTETGPCLYFREADTLACSRNPVLPGAGSERQYRFRESGGYLTNPSPSMTIAPW